LQLAVESAGWRKNIQQLIQIESRAADIDSPAKMRYFNPMQRLA